MMAPAGITASRKPASLWQPQKDHNHDADREKQAHSSLHGNLVHADPRVVFGISRWVLPHG